MYEAMHQRRSISRPITVHVHPQNNEHIVCSPFQNVPAAGNFAAFSQFLAAYSTLDITRKLLAGKGTWYLLPTTPSMLPTATTYVF